MKISKAIAAFLHFHRPWIYHLWNTICVNLKNIETYCLLSVLTKKFYVKDRDVLNLLLLWSDRISGVYAAQTYIQVSNVNEMRRSASLRVKILNWI